MLSHFQQDRRHSLGLFECPCRFHAQSRYKHQEKYLRIKSRIENLIGKLESHGCDVSEIKDDLTTLDSLLTDLANAWRQFRDALYGTQEFACGESEGQFRAQVQASHSELAGVKQAAQALRNFVKGELKADLQTLKQSCQLEQD